MNIKEVLIKIKKAESEYCGNFNEENKSVKNLTKKIQNVEKILFNNKIKSIKQYNIVEEVSDCYKILNKSLHYENVLSDLMALLFIRNKAIGKDLLAEIGKINSSDFSVEREFLISGQKGDSLADIILETNYGRLIIEHKIKHSLTRNQIEKYKNNMNKNDTLLVISSKDSDYKIFNKDEDNFVLKSHYWLLERIVKRHPENDSLGSIIISWLIQITSQYKDQKCVKNDMFNIINSKLLSYFSI